MWELEIKHDVHLWAIFAGGRNGTPTPFLESPSFIHMKGVVNLL